MSSENRVLQNNPFDQIIKGCITKPRTKLSDIIRTNAYNTIINTIGWKRFKWSLPENIDLSSDEIERAVCCGCGAIYKVPAWTGSASAGMWVCTPVEWVGVIKADNTADDFITYGADYSVKGSRLTDGYCIIKNNFEMSSDYDFTEWTAEMLNETDISELQLIKWSRMTPVAKVLDNASIGKLEEVLRRVYSGEPWAVYSDAGKVINNGSPTSRDDAVLRLTDETAIEKMHFLSEFHYELIRRLCNLYNIPFRTTAKSAQNLESELHNTDIFSRMLTDDGFQWRKKSIKKLSALLGGECTVEIGDLFKKENEVIENGIESTAPDAKNVSRETGVDNVEKGVENE